MKFQTKQGNMDDLRNDLAHSQARANLLTALVSHYMAELSRYKVEAERARTQSLEIEELRSALHESQAAYDAIIKSISWRITAPLRRAKSIFSKTLIKC
jgi:hypothetical protein